MKIFCIGRNYLEHIDELKNDVPKEIIIFLKPNTALNPNKEKWFLPDFSNQIEYEAELVIKINNNGKNIALKHAHKYYSQITLGIDFTARDIQNRLKSKGLPWEISKGFDGSALIGEFIDIDNIDSSPIIFSLQKNDIIVQQSDSSFMIHSIDNIISNISKYFTLNKGDLIFTGTPSGVGNINIGDKFAGFLFNKNVLNFTVY